MHHETRSRRPTAIDLFAGAGGLSLGFESAGFDVLAAVEYDPVHAATHIFNFPACEVVCRDARQLQGSDLVDAAARGWARLYDEPWDRSVDVVIGGPSCQGFSAIGGRDVSDARNDLVGEFARLVIEIRPRAFCFENVPGILDAKYAPILEAALALLRRAGYSISGHERALAAEDFGVPQRRRRLVVLGVLGDEPPPAPSPQVGPAFTVRDALVGLPKLEGHPEVRAGGVLRLSTRELALLESARTPYFTHSGTRGDGSHPFGRGREFDPSILSGCKPVQHSGESVARFAAATPGKKEPVSRYYRLDESLPALTLRAGTGRERGAFSAPRPLHPLEPRVVTVREAARLHGFPDWFGFHVTNWHAHRQIGNSVPPPLARAAAFALIEALAASPAPAPKTDTQTLGDPALLTMSPTRAAAWIGAPANEVPPPRARQVRRRADQMRIA